MSTYIWRNHMSHMPLVFVYLTSHDDIIDDEINFLYKVKFDKYMNPRKFVTHCNNV